MSTDASPRRTPASPGQGLLTCAVALAILAMLGYAAAKRWRPAPVAETARTEPAPSEKPKPDQLGSLTPWPTPSIGLRPPAYEQPYPASDEPFAFPPLEFPSTEPTEPPLPEPSTPPSAPAPAEVLADEPEAAEAPLAESASGLPEFFDPLDAPPTEAPQDGEHASTALQPLFDAPPLSVSDDAVKSPALALDAQEAPPTATAALPPPPDIAPNKPAESVTDAEAELADSAPLEELLIDTLAPTEVSKLLADDVREAFALGRHGALFAARSRFIGVLRRVALAKDAAEKTNRHSLALAAGLRAVDEATAFEPTGDAMEADLDAAAIAASHATPLFKQPDRSPSPHEAIARYHRYAMHKLGAAVRGDQAGSMALHGLGKTYARLAELGEAPLADRTSLTMYRAALAAHGENHLAANELGVGLAKAGRHEAARQAFSQAISGGASSTAYRNLAVVDAKLGRPMLADAARRRADQLAARERASGAFSRERGVEWVTPRQFTRVADASRQTPPPTASIATAPRGPVGPTPTQVLPSTPSQPAPQTQSFAPASAWRQPLIQRRAAQPAPIARLAPSNRAAPPASSQTIVR